MDNASTIIVLYQESIVLTSLDHTDQNRYTTTHFIDPISFYRMENVATQSQEEQVTALLSISYRGEMRRLCKLWWRLWDRSLWR